MTLATGNKIQKYKVEQLKTKKKVNIQEAAVTTTELRRMANYTLSFKLTRTKSAFPNTN